MTYRELRFAPAKLEPDAFSYQRFMSEFGIDKPTAKRVVENLKRQRVLLSECRTYQVNVTDVPAREGWPAMVHLSIKRVDRAPINDWRVMQSIKNAIVGPEIEAVELYPAESRLMDTANQYHLWALTSADVRFPFGFDCGRQVTDKPGGKAQQRPLRGETVSPTIEPTNTNAGN